MITAISRFCLCVCVWSKYEIFIRFCLFSSSWEFARVGPARPGAEWCTGSPIRNYIAPHLSVRQNPGLSYVCLCGVIHCGFEFVCLCVCVFLECRCGAVGRISPYSSY